MDQPDLAVSVPMFTLANDGAVEPNPVFHRAFNKLHSRCIEYPFAASTLQQGERILDLGVAQADPLWLNYLARYPANPVFSDVTPFTAPSGIPFVQADCRALPFTSHSFDRVIAISIIEHVGLLRPQTLGQASSGYGADGDMETILECSRILKKGGELVLTVPFGIKKGYSHCASARVYALEDIARLCEILCPVKLDYYEYQFVGVNCFGPAPFATHSLLGKVTWRRIPMDEGRAKNWENMDGILCSVWKKDA